MVYVINKKKMLNEIFIVQICSYTVNIGIVKICNIGFFTQLIPRLTLAWNNFFSLYSKIFSLKLYDKDIFILFLQLAPYHRFSIKELGLQ